MPDSLSDSDIPVLASGFRLQFEQVQDTWVLLYPEGMVKLNQSAAEILKRCDGKASVADIVSQLETAFDASDLKPEVLSFLDIARQQHWVSFN